MILYRCSLGKWSKDLSGQGAFLYGGRWNTKDHRMIYTSENNLLAALEVAIRIPLAKISSDYTMVSIQVSDDFDVYIPKLIRNWNINKKHTQSVGDNFLIENKFLLMKVPSALMSNTFNYLINPMHQDFNKTKIGRTQALVFDERLIKMMRHENE